LSRGAEVVGRNSGNHRWLTVLAEFEEVLVAPDIGAVQVIVDGDFADKLDPFMEVILSLLTEFNR
jgi:hypothetical protein